MDYILNLTVLNPTILVTIPQRRPCNSMIITITINKKMIYAAMQKTQR